MRTLRCMSLRHQQTDQATPWWGLYHAKQVSGPRYERSLALFLRNGYKGN